MEIDNAMSNGFGFGGVNASVIFRRWADYDNKRCPDSGHFFILPDQHIIYLLKLKQNRGNIIDLNSSNSLCWLWTFRIGATYPKLPRMPER